MTKAVLGIIGGSGIYDLPGLENVREQRIASPWGEPSSALRIGEIDGLPVVFLSRHDKGHRLSPSDINYRANIDVLEARRRHRSGVAVGLRLVQGGTAARHLRAGRSVRRPHPQAREFVLRQGLVAHVSMAHPVSPRLRARIGEAALQGRHRAEIRRHLRVHGGPAIFHLRREHDLQGARLFGDRHDQHAGGQARARSGDLLRQPSPW